MVKIIRVEHYVEATQPRPIKIYHIVHTSKDGLTIPSYLLTDSKATPRGSVVYIPPSKYGGIIRYGSTKYNENIIITSRWFISKGLSVYIVDRRGAWGHGEEYMRKADIFGLDVEDIVTGVTSMIERDMLPEPRFLFGYCTGGTLGALVLRNHGIFAKAFFISSFFDIQKWATRKTGFEKWDAFLRETYPELMFPPFLQWRSPVLFVDQTDPDCEIYLFHGKNDQIVLSEQSEMFYNLLKKGGKRARLYIVQDFNHDRNYAAPGRPYTEWVWSIIGKAISHALDKPR